MAWRTGAGDFGSLTRPIKRVRVLSEEQVKAREKKKLPRLMEEVLRKKRQREALKQRRGRLFAARMARAAAARVARAAAASVVQGAPGGSRDHLK